MNKILKRKIKVIYNMNNDEWKYNGDRIRIIRRGDNYTYIIKDKGFDDKIKKIDISKNQINIFDYLERQEENHDKKIYKKR